MCFSFAATFKECGLSLIELFYLVKPSRFNMIMSVKTIGHFFVQKIFDDVISGYNAMYVNNNCHTGVFMLSFQKVHNW